LVSRTAVLERNDSGARITGHKGGSTSHRKMKPRVASERELPRQGARSDHSAYCCLRQRRRFSVKLRPRSDFRGNFVSYSKSALTWALFALSICYVGRAYAEQKKLSLAAAACRSKELTYRLVGLMAQRDLQTAASLYHSSGCMLIPAGTTVDVEHWSVVGPLTLDCLRPPGLPDCYWSVRDERAVHVSAPKQTQTEQAPEAPIAPSPTPAHKKDNPPSF
jgi:hypothetical protein